MQKICLADCTDIKIGKPSNQNAEAFRNKKGFFSIKVQVVSGPNKEILDIVARHPGSSHNNVIFDRSVVKVRFEKGDVSGLLIGDNQYLCRHYLLTPMVQPANTQEISYNAAHVTTKNTVDRLLEAWKRQFPCLQRGLRTKLETTLAIICATAVLYNLGLRENQEFYEGGINVVSSTRNVNDAKKGLSFRRRFIQDHFIE
ncbi:hypothetical protein RN001_015055 [Aquatica leii]|uniref:DDE Tnp4 domain-containing protein n=1 Tax=Aquatica leii TaxID=1421715 RepID=A0AAN7P0H1_9COLE|nr:hypothetical protein RN001_015055 [Aquatica leii]